MFINFSNHPSDSWDEKQLKAAEKYGPVVDVPFPDVDPSLDETAILELAKESVDRIKKHTTGDDVVMVQGEFSLTYAVISLLKKRNPCESLKRLRFIFRKTKHHNKKRSGIKVVSACSERKVQTSIDAEGNTTRRSVFTFVRFREYT